MLTRILVLLAVITIPCFSATVMASRARPSLPVSLSEDPKPDGEECPCGMDEDEECLPCPEGDNGY